MKNIILIFIVFISVAACDLFRTRDGEIPDKSRSNSPPAVTPSILIDNLKNSFKDKNVQNYIDCFVDTVLADKRFTFSASGEALLLYQVFLQGWGLNEERKYFTSVINKVTDFLPVTLSLSNENFTSFGDSSIYSATYNINVPVPTGDPFPQNYEGSLQFSMLRDSQGKYVIYSWKDIKSSSLPSWSELKGSSY